MSSLASYVITLATLGVALPAVDALFCWECVGNKCDMVEPITAVCADIDSGVSPYCLSMTYADGSVERDCGLKFNHGTYKFPADSCVQVAGKDLQGAMKAGEYCSCSKDDCNGEDGPKGTTTATTVKEESTSKAAAASDAVQTCAVEHIWTLITVMLCHVTSVMVL